MQTFKPYELDEYFIQIKQNSKIEKLLNSIDLSEDFLLDIIFVEDIRSAHVVKLFLNESIQEKKITLPKNHPTTYEQYIEYFFEPLQSINVSKIKDSILIFDLTFLDKDCMYDTERFLIKLNEFRNKLTNNINRPVVMILPKALKELFITFAQDTWTIRTVTATVYLNTKIDTKITQKSVQDNSIISHENNKINQLHKEYIELEKVANNDAISRRLFMINNIEIGDYHFKTASLTDAMAYYKKALKLAQLLPKSIEAKRDVSVSLDKVADIYLQKEDASKALEYYQESLKLRKSITKIRPKSIEAKRDVSVSLDNIANIYLQKGDASRALEHYKESLKIKETINKIRPENTEAKRDMSISLNKVADIYLQKGDASKALGYYQESLKLTELITKIRPKSIEAKRDLGVNLINLANTYSKLGNKSKAKSYLEDAKIVNKF